MTLETSSISFDSFSDYKKVVASLARDLAQIRGFSHTLQMNKSSMELLDGVIKRLNEDTFSIAVVGEFRKGKSSFINALLGRSILPSDVLPTTAALNRVTYGITPTAKIFFKDPSKEPVEVGIDHLPHYVTKLTNESENMAAGVREAVVYYPLAFCQNNVDIIDTPGLNDETGMSQVTYGVLSQVDAAILIIASNNPFAESERYFLEDKILASDLGRVIFVVNLWANHTDEEAGRILEHIKGRIQKLVVKRAEEHYGADSEDFKIYRQKIGEPKVFGVFVKPALEARLSGDIQALASSRLPPFEQALEKFLTLEGGVIRLQVPVNRIIASSHEILSTLDITEQALTMKQEDFRAAYEHSVREIKSLRERQRTELRLIDAAASDVMREVRPLIYAFPQDVQQTVRDTVAAFSITPGDLKNKKKLAETIGANVKVAVEHNADRLAVKVQDLLQKGVDQEVERLKDFAHTIDRTLESIETQFIDIEATEDRPRSSAGEAITATLSVFTGFGGIWSGYRVAGAKGAAVGAATSAGVFFLAGVVGAPVTIPVIVAVAIVSFFTGKWTTQWIWGDERVEQFKGDFTAKAWNRIDEDLRSLHLEQKIDDQISLAFGTIKATLGQEVEAMLDNTQKTLSDLSDKRGRDEAQTEVEQQRNRAIRQDTLQIIGNAQRLADQLMEIRSV